MEDADYFSQRNLAFAEVQALFNGRYSLEIVASVCSAMLCNSVALASETVVMAEMLIEEYVDTSVEVMRVNWDALQAARRLMTDVPQGRA